MRPITCLNEFPQWKEKDIRAGTFEVMTQNFPKLMKDIIEPQIQESIQTQAIQIFKKIFSLTHHSSIVKKKKNQEQLPLKAARK